MERAQNSSSTNPDECPRTVENERRLRVGNSNISGNTLFPGGAASDVGGPMHSLGHNLVQSINGATITHVLPGNLHGLDPLLAPLAPLIAALNGWDMHRCYSTSSPPMKRVYVCQRRGCFLPCARDSEALDHHDNNDIAFIRTMDERHASD